MSHIQVKNTLNSNLASNVLVFSRCDEDVANINRILSNIGYSVRGATSSQQVVNAAKAEKPDMIFVDIAKTGMDGYKTSRRIASETNTNDIPIVFLSNGMLQELAA